MNKTDIAVKKMFKNETVLVLDQILVTVLQHLASTDTSHLEDS
jgi:hypothetical protein